MSEDLRQKVVEAMARAVHAHSQGRFYDFDRIGPRIRQKYLDWAEAALDAALDILADNAEAWVTLIDPGLKWNAGSIAIRDARDLIDALRSNSKGDGE